MHIGDGWVVASVVQRSRHDPDDLADTFGHAIGGIAQSPPIVVGTRRTVRSVQLIATSRHRVGLEVRIPELASGSEVNDRGAVVEVARFDIVGDLTSYEFVGLSTEFACEEAHISWLEALIDHFADVTRRGNHIEDSEEAIDVGVDHVRDGLGDASEANCSTGAIDHIKYNLEPGFTATE